jgi:hypothetical protein
MAWFLYRNVGVGWVTEDIVIRFPERQEMFLHPFPPASVRKITGPHPVSYSMNNGDLFAFGKNGRSVQLPTHLHIMLKVYNLYNFTSITPIP